MEFGLKYDDEEMMCHFCNKKVRPIIQRNKMDVGFGIAPGPLFGRAGFNSGKKKKNYILICPDCKALIGSKSK